MATEIQTGTATVWGIPQNGTNAIAIPGYATFLLQGAKPQHKFTLTEIKDANGFDANLIASNAHYEMDLDFHPSGATRTAAQAVAVFLTPLQSVAVANFAVTAANGTWIYVGDETIDLIGNGSAKISLKLRKYADTTQNTSLATTISG